MLDRQVKPAMTKKERILTESASEPLDEYIDATVRILELSIEEAWRPAVRANLEVSLRLARMVDQFALPDETEPANVFGA